MSAVSRRNIVFSPHERFWKHVPAESVVHVVEDALIPFTEVIEFDNLSPGRLVFIREWKLKLKPLYAEPYVVWCERL